MKPEEMTMLNRLAIVGQYGMGALTYRPEEHFSFEPQGYDLDDLALQCQKILNTEYSEKLDELYLLGGTSGGARPKIMTEIDGEDWIIKFPAHVDGQDAGGMEYEYALCAKACGIDMTEVRLFPSKKCKGYFGIKRFDRERIVDGIGTKVKAGNKKKRIHMLTAAALLELDFEQPSLDYHSLMKLTKILTRDNEADVREMFRRMCFNVFAHNRDDHSKNFTYLYDEMKKGWRLSPAYDLKIDVQYDEQLMLKHDKKWTAEAIFNILDNAVKYTEVGGNIHVVVCRQELFTKISIEDTGKGIAPERQATIFTRFYRELEVHDKEGIGIGLYLAREIITLQNGYIEVQSQIGQGSKFIIYLPNRD